VHGVQCKRRAIAVSALILGRVAHDARGASGQVGPDCPHGLAAHVSSLRAYDLTNNFTVMTAIDITLTLTRPPYHSDWQYCMPVISSYFSATFQSPLG